METLRERAVTSGPCSAAANTILVFHTEMQKGMSDSHTPCAQAKKAAGMTRLPEARASKQEDICATLTLKYCLTRVTPPKKTLVPRTRRRLDSMLPIRDSGTISISSCTRAMMDTMSSTALLRRRVSESSAEGTDVVLPKACPN